MKLICADVMRLWLLLAATPAFAAVHYVDLNNPVPAPPYTNWVSAATTIQDAIDVADAGDEIVVTNGVYQTGGWPVEGAENRVAVRKRLTVRSVNGPDQTVIDGGGAVRCMYLTDGAALVGFTLTHGTAETGGGVWCASTSAVVSNCVLTNNVATYKAGGAFSGTLENCTLIDNSANNDGGGACSSVLNNCALIANLAYWHGGGTSFGTLNNCTLSGNWAHGYGGGASESTLNTCTLIENSADYYGGGASYATLNNCTLAGNSTVGSGGGAYASTLNNCMLTGNSAGDGGGTAGRGPRRGSPPLFCHLNNCIVYYNTAGQGGVNYDAYSRLNYCCTTPLPPDGVGNLASDPQLASSSHLSANSPCRGAGASAFATGVDIDGEPWVNPPSIGCDEVHPGFETGPLTVTLHADFTNVATGFEINLTADITGYASGNRWELGDGTIVSNRLAVTHAWSALGDYAVVVRAFNQDNPAGVSATVIVHVVLEVHYVATDSSNPSAPYSSWATAANTIQEAVDSVTAMGALVLVSNGVYQTGGRAVSELTNRVAVTQPMTIKSVNGPEVTDIRGYQVPDTTNGNGAIRCVFLTNRAVLVGFTLTDGATQTSGDWNLDTHGGGVWCAAAGALVSNCVLRGNSAYGYGGGAYAFKYGDLSGTLNHCKFIGNVASQGGGVGGGTLNNCTLTGNSAYYGGGASTATLNNCTINGNSAEGQFGGGGGADECTLNNCTVAGNSAPGPYAVGGGVAYGWLKNCIVYSNTAAGDVNNYDSYSTFNYSCTFPFPGTGIGNLAADPQLASASHLSAGSPCRAVGNPAYTTGTDIDGDPWANPPSIGCDEVHPGTAAGPISVAIQASFTNVATEFEVSFTAQINGILNASRWEFGDGTVVSNRPYATHAFLAAGAYPVILRAYNQSHPGGVSATAMVQVVFQPVYYVASASSTPVAPYFSWATAAANIQDAVDAAIPGATILVSNGVYQTGGRAVFGMLSNRVAVTKPLTLRSVNGPEVTVIRGFQMPGLTNGDGAIRCVYLANGASLVGFKLSNGATRTWPGLYDEQSGGGVWCESARPVVSNCVLSANSAAYLGGGAYGGTLYHCTLTSNLSPVGGAASHARLNNCRLTDNSASDRGGGVDSSTLVNCTLTNNSGFYFGGGAYGSTLNNCLLTGNSAGVGGGGVAVSTLNNCTLTGNTANDQYYGGGGAYACTLNNCIVYFNTAPNLISGSSGENYEIYSTLNHCCSTPLPYGVGNFTNAPLFVDQAGDNLRLQASSPCNNSGQNLHAPAGPELDGLPRITGGTVDVGAYEYQSPQSAISYAWLQGWGLPTDGSADFTDADGDRLNNWQEWRCGTDPTNALSALRLGPPTPVGADVLITWESVPGRSYVLETTSNLSALTPFAPLASHLPASVVAGTTTFMHTNIGAGPRFYRVRLEE